MKFTWCHSNRFIIFKSRISNNSYIKSKKFHKIMSAPAKQSQMSNGSTILNTKKDKVNVGIMLDYPKGTPERDILDNLPKEANVIIDTLDGFSKASNEDIGSIEVLVLSAFGTKINGYFGKLKNLKWMHTITAGIDSLCTKEIIESDVVLTNAKGVFSNSLAEFALFSCNYFAKRLPEILNAQKSKIWQKLIVEELKNRTMGIVGLGSIGMETAKLAKAYKMNVIGLRRNKKISTDEKDIISEIYGTDQLCEMMSKCDYVVAALPSTIHTNKYIDKAAFESMKPNAVFINIGRGNTVNENDLIEILKEKKIKGAALDVFEKEPLPEISPLWDLDNVLLTAHTADMTDDFITDAIKAFVKNLKNYIDGQPLMNVTDKSAGY